MFHSYFLTIIIWLQTSPGDLLKGIGDDIRTALFPNAPIFFAHLIATIILLSVIVRFGYKPFRESLEKRHKYISDQIKSAQEKSMSSALKDEEADTYLTNAKIKAVETIYKAKIEGNAKRHSIIEDATKKANKIIDDAKNHIEQEKKDLQTQMKNEILNNSIELAEKILKKELSKVSHQKLIDQFISDLNKKNADRDNIDE